MRGAGAGAAARRRRTGAGVARPGAGYIALARFGACTTACTEAGLICDEAEQAALSVSPNGKPDPWDGAAAYSQEHHDEIYGHFAYLDAHCGLGVNPCTGDMGNMQFSYPLDDARVAEKCVDWAALVTTGKTGDFAICWYGYYSTPSLTASCAREPASYAFGGSAREPLAPPPAARAAATLAAVAAVAAGATAVAAPAAPATQAAAGATTTTTLTRDEARGAIGMGVPHRRILLAKAPCRSSAWRTKPAGDGADGGADGAHGADGGRRDAPDEQRRQRAQATRRPPPRPPERLAERAAVGPPGVFVGYPPHRASNEVRRGGLLLRLVFRE